MTTPIDPIKTEISLLLRLLLEGPYAGAGGKGNLCVTLSTSYATLRKWLDPQGGGIRMKNISAIRDLARKEQII